MLEAVSAGLSLTSAAIIISVLMGGGDTQMLFLAAFCCILVAVYQTINFYLGYKLQQNIDRTRVESTDQIEANAGRRVKALSAADAAQLVNRHSVTESTTELLEPVPRVTKENHD